MTGSDITVIIPAYNAQQYLAEAVQSIKAQTLCADAKIIIINDGSEDRTAELAESLSDRYISLPHGGAAKARNAGLKELKTEYCFFLDADDRVCSGAFQVFLSAFQDAPELQIVYGLTKDFISPELSDEQKGQVCPKQEPYSGTLVGCSLIRTRLFEQIGVFDEELSSGEVIDWVLRSRAAGTKVANINQVMLERRIHLTNTGRLKRKEEVTNYAAILRRRLRKGE